MLQIIGWLGGLFLAVCGAPLAWEAWRRGEVDRGLNWLFLNLWFWGEVFVLIYVSPQLLWPLIANYSFNIFLIAIIMRYKKWPRKRGGS